jgi:hypothetical protein
MIGLTLLLVFVTFANAACQATSFWPARPPFPINNYGGTVGNVADFVKNHWSEAVTLPRPSIDSPNDAIPTTCPSQVTTWVSWNDPATWPGGTVPANGADVTLPAGKAVLIACGDVDTLIFGNVVIPATSELLFAHDQDGIHFQAKSIDIQGKFTIGNPSCRVGNKLTITIHGRRSDGAGMLNKGIVVTGQIDIHGTEYFPTWTRLAKTAWSGNSTIFIQDCPNWQPGQKIAITTTELKDARDFNRNEEKIISSISLVPAVSATTCAITLTTPLAYTHWGGPEYQAEVALLSRDILIQGDPDNSEPTDTIDTPCAYDGSPSTYPCENYFLTGFGVHIMIAPGTASARFRGVELYRAGQTNILGRYPIHWHQLGNITQGNHYASDCSVHHSFFRCFAIHGTSGDVVDAGVVLTKNTGFDIIGHCYFCSEDGIEENHVITYNFGAYIHILGPYWQASEGISEGGFTTQGEGGSQSFGSQYTDIVTANPNLILADDVGASPFYFTNANSRIVGNAASGGWSGFSFPNLDAPVGNAYQQVWHVPKNRPLGEFRGNSAHSTGFWQGHAAGVYLGGNLFLSGTPTDTVSMTKYTTGRHLPARDTCADPYWGGPMRGGSGCPEESQVWMRFTDTKVFLSNIGLQSWGNREELINFEVHDCALSTNVFGEVWIDNMLVECRSNHVPTYLSGCNISHLPEWHYWDCNPRDNAWWRAFGGFQFYDTAQSHLVTNTKFKNCQSVDEVHCYSGTCDISIFTYLTHSDQFTPGLMQMTNNIQYENVDVNHILEPSTDEFTKITVSGRASNWIDGDGSVTGLFPGIYLNHAGMSWPFFVTSLQIF